jgi:hypothetical protein
MIIEKACNLNKYKINITPENLNIFSDPKLTLKITAGKHPAIFHFRQVVVKRPLSSQSSLQILRL